MLKLKCLHFTSKNTHVNQKDIKNNYPYRIPKFQILFSMCFCQTTNTVTSFLCLGFFPATILERAITPSHRISHLWFLKYNFPLSLKLKKICSFLWRANPRSLVKLKPDRASKSQENLWAIWVCPVTRVTVKHSIIHGVKRQWIKTSNFL